MPPPKSCRADDSTREEEHRPAGANLDTRATMTGEFCDDDREHLTKDSVSMSSGVSSERALLERLARMDDSAWRWLFSAYGDTVYGFCLRMVRSRDDALDIRQEVFARAVGAIGKFRGEASIKTWLLQIARNLCLTHIAAAKKNMECASDHDWVANVASEEPGGDCSAASNELREALELAIGELEPVFREALLLREVEGLSYEEIARVAGVSIDTVKTRIHRARLKLRKRLAGFR